MTVVAEFTAPAGDYPLGRLLATLPEVRVRLDRIVPVGRQVAPFLWVGFDRPEAVEQALAEDPTVEAFEVVHSVGDETLVRVEWSREFDGLADAVLEVDAGLLSATGEDERWRFQLRFTEREDAATFHQRCQGRGMDLTLERVFDPGDPEETVRSLTDRQREALATALAAGYYDVPRETNLTELSELLEISDVAVSQRLRRGVRTVLQEAFEES